MSQTILSCATQVRKPTAETYTEFQRAYDFFNGALFHGELPQCLISLQRHPRARGYFCKDRFQTREEEKAQQVHEIAMNPTCFAGRSDEAILSTLVHEMVHLWQQQFGKPGRGRYHNREWGDRMEVIGLVPSNTGEPGGARTGDRMTHYILDGGPYQLAYRELEADGFRLSWQDTPPPPTVDIRIGKGGQVLVRKINRSNRHKYTCPECGTNAWASPGILLNCGSCDVSMREVD